jgi:hypothetical protein
METGMFNAPRTRVIAKKTKNPTTIPRNIAAIILKILGLGVFSTIIPYFIILV